MTFSDIATGIVWEASELERIFSLDSLAAVP
jgi:hypothetical protein